MLILVTVWAISVLNCLILFKMASVLADLMNAKDFIGIKEEVEGAGLGGAGWETPGGTYRPAPVNGSAY